MELSPTGYEEQIRRARLALRGACCAGRRHGLVVALALLLALLNPALCVLHCVMLHGAHGAAPAGGGQAGHDQSRHAHQQHAAMAQRPGHHDHAAMGQQPAAGDPGPAMTLCEMMRGAEGAGQPMPRALYELAPLAALLVVLTLLPLHAPAGAPLAIRPLPRRSPPTPPPRPFA